MSDDRPDTETPDELTALIAAETDLTVEEIEEAAAAFEIEDPEDADFDYCMEAWEDSAAYQEY